MRSRAMSNRRRCQAMSSKPMTWARWATRGPSVARRERRVAHRGGGAQPLAGAVGTARDTVTHVEGAADLGEGVIGALGGDEAVDGGGPLEHAGGELGDDLELVDLLGPVPRPAHADDALAHAGRDAGPLARGGLEGGHRRGLVGGHASAPTAKLSYCGGCSAPPELEALRPGCPAAVMSVSVALTTSTPSA